MWNQVKKRTRSIMICLQVDMRIPPLSSPPPPLPLLNSEPSRIIKKLKILESVEINCNFIWLVTCHTIYRKTGLITPNSKWMGIQFLICVLLDYFPRFWPILFWQLHLGQRSFKWKFHQVQVKNQKCSTASYIE